MGKALGRIASFVIVALSWMLLGVRIVLNLIGYATLPEDAAIADQRYRHIFLWLLGIPWPYLLGFALIGTIVLMLVSWPGFSFPGLPDRYSSLRVDADRLIDRLRAQERDARMHDLVQDMQLPHDLRAFHFDLQDCGLKVPEMTPEIFSHYAVFCAVNAYYLEAVKPFLRRKRIGAAKQTAKEVIAHLEPIIPQLIAESREKES
jgi:hypothetical protein